MIRSLNRIFAVATLFFKDGIKRYALLGIFLFALCLETCAIFFIDSIPRDIGRVSIDFILSVVWIAGFLFLLFHATNTLAWNDEQKYFHVLLIRPISRSEYIMGSFSGLFLLLFIINTLLAGVGYWIAIFIKNSVSDVYFPIISIGKYIFAVISIHLIETVVLAVIVLFSSVIRGAFAVFLMTFSYYLVCNGLPVVRHAFEIREVGSGLSYVSDILKYLTIIFPDFGHLDTKNTVITETAVFTSHWQVFPYVMAIIYIIMVLFFSCMIFNRRELK